ncbi:MAG TPA: VTT domain-containing protein [Blastocatellia bacterium]|nr:VTT domain-containing protein [Blastocatellia bacterium]
MQDAKDGGTDLEPPAPSAGESCRESRSRIVELNERPSFKPAPAPLCVFSAFVPIAASFASVIAGVKDRLADLGAWLIAFGAIGLFGIALLDSALVPLPAGPDLVMITLSWKRPSLMPLYALAATVGSTIGCAFLYLLARRAGSSALRRVSPERRERIENLLGRYDMLAVMVPAVLPPPFPFKAFVLSAGVFRLKLSRFVTAILVGRAARFLIEGWLAVRFGEEAFQIIKRHSLGVFIGVAGIILVWIAAVFFRRRARQSAASRSDEL